MITISVAEDFTRYPAGRVERDGPFSGELFRRKFLEPALDDHEEIEVAFDGVRGYGSSFLEEAFGGLRRSGYDKALIQQTIHFSSKDPSLLKEIQDYIDNSNDES